MGWVGMAKPWLNHGNECTMAWDQDGMRNRDGMGPSMGWDEMGRGGWGWHRISSGGIRMSMGRDSTGLDVDMGRNGMRWDGMGWVWMGWDGIGWAGMDWMGLDGMGLDGIGCKWDGNGMGWDNQDGIARGGMGWDGIGWDGMKWDGIGHGMGWGWMGWDETDGMG